MSSESWSSLDDFNTVSNTDIDNLWISLKMKTSPFTNDNNHDQNQSGFPNTNIGGSVPGHTPFTPSVMTPFWQSLAQPSNQQQQQPLQQHPQQRNYQQPTGFNEGGSTNNPENGANSSGQCSGGLSGNANGGELKTLNDFDLFNSFPWKKCWV